jgi:hypothetical protein
VDDKRAQAPWREEDARIEAIWARALEMREAACRDARGSSGHVVIPTGNPIVITECP